MGNRNMQASSPQKRAGRLCNAMIYRFERILPNRKPLMGPTKSGTRTIRSSSGLEGFLALYGQRELAERAISIIAQYIRPLTVSEFILLYAVSLSLDSMIGSVPVSPSRPIVQRANHPALATMVSYIARKSPRPLKASPRNPSASTLQNPSGPSEIRW